MNHWRKRNLPSPVPDLSAGSCPTPILGRCLQDLTIAIVCPTYPCPLHSYGFPPTPRKTGPKLAHSLTLTLTWAPPESKAGDPENPDYGGPYLAVGGRSFCSWVKFLWKACLPPECKVLGSRTQSGVTVFDSQLVSAFGFYSNFFSWLPWAIPIVDAMECILALWPWVAWALSWGPPSSCPWILCSFLCSFVKVRYWLVSAGGQETACRCV